MLVLLPRSQYIAKDVATYASLITSEHRIQMPALPPRY
ncbi:unnamed protein product [Amoebophrya sp. A25]|nr:unnamed protein product [Amoebophrya sp. A25]|eukprot:GSA25T00018389001.1